ncbi:MAG TPA: aromatic ring-hydroxylating dioxygenase subunit alpha [Candidatus Binatia bacterium]|jgi:phenylpropionate dioxygenase-like ring-hydroxylating dioxygenase large terminal subunit|nr:aromatic ring-hydroxylating dioxygenase subunit alpha [Candidatus Binatia bacterium]
MTTVSRLADDATVVQRILDHIDNRTTDLGDTTWTEPVANYRSETRFAAERDLVLRRYPTPFCPSAALPASGSWVAREAAGTPIVAVRGDDGRVRAFRNACRHRGTQVVEGTGCERALVCRYHGWTYELDGRLRHVPGAHGFPGLDTTTMGLVPVDAVERQGLVFVTQDTPAVTGAELDALPALVGPGFRFVTVNERDVAANWKVVIEGFLEGYHIRSTHPDTFYPLQFDNLNVVERFGRNNRIAFPFRAIRKQRELAPAQRSADGTLTYVYHLFPNAIVATFPRRIFMVALEPLAVDRTRFVTYMLSDHDPSDAPAQAFIEQATALVDAGTLEDQEVLCAVQRGLASGANEAFTFGRFESAIVHFHHTLHAQLDAAGVAA